MANENPHTSPKGAQPRTSLQTSEPATAEQIIQHLSLLARNYWRPEMTEGQYRALHLQYCQDLAGKTDAQIADACRRWRTNPQNKFFPSSGQLLELTKNPYDAPPSTNRYDDSRLPPIPPERMIRREGYYRGSDNDMAAGHNLKCELDDWMRLQVRKKAMIVPSPSEIRRAGQFSMKEAAE